MIFSSIEFLIFFVIFISLLKLLPKAQKELIIISSLVFYSYWNFWFVFILLYLILFTFFFIKKNIKLKLSIPIILIPLFYFKYSQFLIELIQIKSFIIYGYKDELPLAISFVSFTAIAILVDIKTKKYDESLNLLNFSEFLCYFPQLIAGPILRGKELIPLLKKKIFFSKSNFKLGVLLFIVGFIKKIFFADSIAEYIDPIFLDPLSVPQEDLIKGYLLFPLQIYFDFSGYIDMALGISMIMGIELPINFNKPYLSTSITNFWRSWHITLSNWFRDYIYIPIGGSRCNKFKLCLNLILTMTVAGLWHGASLNFILWGFLNGFFLSMEKIFNNIIKLNKHVKIILTCFIIFNLWIIFRIQDMNLILEYFYSLYSNFNNAIIIENFYVLLILVFFIYLQKFDNYQFIKSAAKKLNLTILIPISIIIILTGLGINTGTSEKFIYFDF